MSDSSAPVNIKKGFFIVLEGIDGAGKTTQGKLLGEALAAAGYEIVLTREPTGGQWGMKVREIAAKGRGEQTPEEELEYFLKDREEHVKEIVKPGVNAGKVVICDRYYYSTIAYQGALGLDPDRIRKRNEEDYKFPIPDAVILIELPPRKGLKRIESGRTGGANVGYEKQDYLKKVQRIFDSMKDDNMVRVSGEGSPEEVNSRIVRALKDLLSL